MENRRISTVRRLLAYILQRIKGCATWRSSDHLRLGTWRNPPNKAIYPDKRKLWVPLWSALCKRFLHSSVDFLWSWRDKILCCTIASFLVSVTSACLLVHFSSLLARSALSWLRLSNCLCKKAFLQPSQALWRRTVWIRSRVVIGTHTSKLLWATSILECSSWLVTPLVTVHDFANSREEYYMVSFDAYESRWKVNDGRHGHGNCIDKEKLSSIADAFHNIECPGEDAHKLT